MPLILKDANFHDGRAMASISMDAFFEDRMQQSLFPGMSKEKRIKRLIDRWPQNYGDLSKQYKKVIDSETGAVVSYASWTFAFTDAGGLRKLSDVPETAALGPPSTLEGLNDPFATDFTERIVALRNNHVGTRPQLQLKMMGTSPDYRKRGAGSMHLQWGTQVADQHNLVCWLEASPMSVSLYEKHGFKGVGTVTMDLDGSCGGGHYTHTCMIREPKYDL